MESLKLWIIQILRSYQPESYDDCRIHFIHLFMYLFKSSALSCYMSVARPSKKDTGLNKHLA